MKLIDLLVRELPKHGGWPEWAKECVYFPYMGNAFFYDENGNSSMHSGFRSIAYKSGDTQEVDREQYEAALAAAQQPVWNGEGLPPVGTICMANLANGWTDVKVAYIGDEGGWREALVFEVKSTKPAWADEFRPIHSEADKKRDEVVDKIYEWADETFDVSNEMTRDVCKILYDAIAAGKIPGVKLED